MDCHAFNRRKFMTKLLWTRSVLLAAIAAFIAPFAVAETTIYELRITNDTSKDLTFRLQDGHSKHASLTYDKKSVDEHTIKAGTYGVIGVKPTGHRCTTDCGACNPTYGKVYAYYTDDKGKEQRNNYYKPKLEWYEYCGYSGSKPVTSYTTNWSFEHGGGQGTNHFKHDQTSKHNSYTTGNASMGLTFDAKHVSGHTTVQYSE